MNDLSVTIASWDKGYFFMEVEDIFDKDTKRVSGVTMKMEPDLETKELDLEWIIKNRPRVMVSYTWDYSKYCLEEDYPDDLPFSWTTESLDGVIDQNDEFTWPHYDKIEWYLDGELVRSREWSYEEDWDLR